MSWIVIVAVYVLSWLPVIYIGRKIGKVATALDRYRTERSWRDRRDTTTVG